MIYIVEALSLTKHNAVMSACTMAHAELAVKLLKEEMPERHWSIMTSKIVLNVPAFEKYLRKS